MKKTIGEWLHAQRIVILIICFVSLLAQSVNLYLIGTTLGKGLAILILLAFAVFVLSGFEKFKTDHNMAQLSLGNTILNFTFLPGEFIYILPFFSIIQQKGDQLLDVNELSIVIETKEVQFKQDEILNKGGKDSVDAKKFALNYYLDKKDIYNFFMRASDNYKTTLANNLSADYALAFQRRIPTLTDAAAFKDFKFWHKDGDNKDGNGNDLQIDRSGFYLTQDTDEGCNMPELYIPEFKTSLERMNAFGLYPNNITIDGFQDSPETDKSRNDIKRQEFDNEKLETVSTGRKNRINQYTLDYESAGFSKKEATLLARQDVMAEEGKRTEIGTGSDSNLLINLPKN